MMQLSMKEEYHRHALHSHLHFFAEEPKQKLFYCYAMKRLFIFLYDHQNLSFD